VNPALRGPLVVAACVAAIGLGWCTIRVTRADALAKVDPQAALRIAPANLEALLRTARRQLRDGDNDAAIATARRVLSNEPAQGEGFALVALAAIASGSDNASSLLSVAARRAPSDSAIRGQSAAENLKDGDLTAAMHQIDAVLRLGGPRATRVYMGIVAQAESPQFAEALAATLAADPPWRDSYMHLLAVKGTAAGLDHVNAALQRRGELTPAETGHWLDRMFSDDRWGEAYAHWVGTLKPMPATLPLAYNGSFEEVPSNIGFDWHKARVAGVATEIEPDSGATGTKAAHFRFLGLRAAGGDMRLPLLLAPGNYRLALRAHAEYLRSDQGLRWKIRCANGQEIASTEALADSFQWREIEVAFEVPAAQCPGQWLALENPAVAGSAQQVSGDLWTDDIRVTPLPKP
jgi:Tfp pilus assembly protein PilF